MNTVTVEQKEEKRTRRSNHAEIRDIGTIFVYRDIFETLRSLKGGLTWSDFLRLLSSLYEGLILGVGGFKSSSEVYELAKRLEERLPPVVRFRRLSSRVDIEGRHWVKKYVGREVYGATVIRGFSSLTVWVAVVDDKLVLINIKTNFINPISREAYMEMLKQAILVAIKRLCSERVCRGFAVDPEMPLDPEVSRELDEWLNKAREMFYKALREIAGESQV
jgi:predicted CopG family antitoxin